MTTIRTQQPTFVFQPFAPAADDPLASAHRTVLAWVEAAAATRGQDNWYQDVELRSLAEGVAIAGCAAARRCAMRSSTPCAASAYAFLKA